MSRGHHVTEAVINLNQYIPEMFCFLIMEAEFGSLCHILGGSCHGELPEIPKDCMSGERHIYMLSQLQLTFLL